MHNSNTNNHLFLKAFLLFLIVFVFSASNDFKKRSNHETNQEIGLCIELKQQANAVLVLLPKLQSFKANCSFGNENDFLFSNLELTMKANAKQNVNSKLKSLMAKHLTLKKKLKIQAFSTVLHQKNDIPVYYSA